MTTAAENQVDEAAAFADGFSGNEETQNTAPVVEEVNSTEAAKAVAEPETVTITKDQWQNVQSGLAEIENFKRSTRTEFDKLGGKYGEINRAMQQRPAGVRISKDALAEIEAEYPELGKKLKTVFLDGVDNAPSNTGNNPDIEQLVQAKLAPELERLKKLELQQVEFGMKALHRDYSKVIKTPEWADWLRSLPPEEAQQTVNSWDVDFCAGQLDKFKVHAKTLEEQAAADAKKAAEDVNRLKKQQNGTRRLEGAITPQGAGKAGAPVKTEYDYFKEGFRS